MDQPEGGGRDSPEGESLGIEIDSSTIDESVSRFPTTPPAAAGLRPETAPASTPLDLECKAYYMARNIGIETVCTVSFVFAFGAALLSSRAARASVGHDKML